MLEIRSVVGGFRVHKYNPQRKQYPGTIKSFFFSVLGIEREASHMLGKNSAMDTSPGLSQYRVS